MLKKIVCFILLGVVAAVCHGDYMDLVDNYSLENRGICHKNDVDIHDVLVIGDIVKLDLNDSYIIAYQYLISYNYY